MAKSNSAVQQRGGFGKFFRGVKAELKKVVWPTKKELINYTIVVFLVTIFIAFIIYIYLMQSLPNFLIRCCTLLDKGAISWKQIRSGM